MSLKIGFYVATFNGENKEIELLKNYCNIEKDQCIFTINASDICSEFIARYFYKVPELPEILLNSFIKENYKEKDYESAKTELYNGIYKADLHVLIKDNEEAYKFKVRSLSEDIREKLIKKYDDIRKELDKTVKNNKIEIYALFIL